MDLDEVSQPTPDELCRELQDPDVYPIDRLTTYLSAIWDGIDLFKQTNSRFGQEGFMSFVTERSMPKAAVTPFQVVANDDDTH